MSIFYRIVSLILSFIFAVTGYGSLIGGTPIENVDVYESSMSGFLGNIDENYRIFYTYNEWKIFANNISDSAMKEYADGIEKSLFDNHSLVLADIECSSSEWRVRVYRASQDMTTLEIGYIKVREQDMGGSQAICYETIFAVTEKYISKVEFTEKEETTVPFLIDKSAPGLYSIVEADPAGEYPEEVDIKSYLFNDYSSWKSFLNSGEWKFSGYADTVDERYFENKNLALVISPLADSSYSLRIGYPLEQDGSLKISYYAVNEVDISLAVEGFDAAFVETSKNIETIEVTDGGDIDIPFKLDGSLPMI